jgi:hypothetical protein
MLRVAVVLALVHLAVGGVSGVAAQDVPDPAAPIQPTPAADDDPYATPWRDGGRVWSMGQPPLLKWSAGALVDPANDRGLGVVGLQKDFGNPLVGLFSARVEGLLGGGRDGVDGGARLLGVSPLGRFHVGLDYDARAGDTAFLLGVEAVVRRGGLFHRGTRLRVDWLPARDQTVQVGVSVPLGQRAGRTRPHSDHVRLPSVPRPPEARRTTPALQEFRAAAEAVTRLVVPLHNTLGSDPVRAVAADVAQVQALDRPERVLDRMLGAWRGAFAAELDPAGAGRDPDAIARIAARARRIVLEDVLLPYDGLLGRRRRPATLYAFVPQAEQRFRTELAAMPDLSPVDHASALRAFHGIVGRLDDLRDAIRRDWDSDRRTFLPLQLALAPDEADTQAEIDALIERATADRFSDGNLVYYVINEEFQFELSRTIRRAEQYHVLWIHDVQGRSASGPVDRVSAMHVKEYLDALADRVARYDETGSLPQYFVFLDQFYYESNRGRPWMTLLERPLDQEIAFPPAYAAEQQQLRASQQTLRAAVAGSRRLQADRARFGDAWLKALVKVHVSITHPADFAFWSNGLIPFLGMPDNLMRDHRKIVFYDLAEDDPARGEVMFTGMGIGEHYAGATWEDRAIILQGPAALPVKAAARRLFERQGVAPSRIAAPFQPRPLAPDYPDRAGALLARIEAGPVPAARVLQSHNDVGYGDKRASVVKALLVSLMPPGTVIVSPDSLWEDFSFGSMLLGSALRGCRVLVIAPSVENAPGSSWPVMTRTQMLLSRLLAMSQALDGRIAAEHGLFKIGIFHEESGVGDLAGQARELIRKAAAAPWLRQMAPLGHDVLERWLVRTQSLAPPSYLVSPPPTIRPKLHMKGLYVASSSAWDGMFALPEMGTAVLEYLEQRSRQVSGATRADLDVRALPQAVWAAQRRLLTAHEAGLTPDQRAAAVRYLQIGSFNMNDRSMLSDGEVELTVSGTAALSGMFDFMSVAAITTWIDRQEQIDAFLPVPTAWKRLLARWARSEL